MDKYKVKKDKFKPIKWQPYNPEDFNNNFDDIK